MDILCTKCGEPWEIDSLHELIADDKLAVAGDPNYEQVFSNLYARFRKEGCAVFGIPCSDNVAHPALLSIAEILGDDVDGYASTVDDFLYLMERYN